MKTKPSFSARLLSLAAVLALAAGGVQAAGLSGSWDGNVTQDNPPATYRLEMILYGDIGNINYPSLGCGGNLEFIRTDGTTYWYREHITYGKDKCIDGGIIQIRRHPLGDPNSWIWQWDGAGITAKGVIQGSGTNQGDGA